MQAQDQIQIRKSYERGHSNYGWLDARYTFSFGDYQNSNWMGFHHLLVMNNDIIQPQGGFPLHSHRDMEIFTYLLEGSLEHQDSMGNGAVIHAGDFQKMSAGTGVRHSEFNPSADEKTRLYQIWILPNQKGLSPSYQQITADELKPFSGLQLIASPSEDAPIQVSQDVMIYCGRMDSNQSVERNNSLGRACWLQMTKGKADLNGVAIESGDGVFVDAPATFKITTSHSAEFLLFDMGTLNVR